MHWKVTGKSPDNSSNSRAKKLAFWIGWVHQSLPGVCLEKGGECKDLQISLGYCCQIYIHLSAKVGVESWTTIHVSRDQHLQIRYVHSPISLKFWVKLLLSMSPSPPVGEYRYLAIKINDKTNTLSNLIVFTSCWHWVAHSVWAQTVVGVNGFRMCWVFLSYVHPFICPSESLASARSSGFIYTPTPTPPPLLGSALDARFMYHTQDLPEPYHQSTLGIPHQPKKRSFAMVPWLVRISNMVFWVGG